MKADYQKIREQIEAVVVENVSIRSEKFRCTPQKEINKAIRALYKDLGICGVRVYSQYSTHIAIPSPEDHPHVDDFAQSWNAGEYKYRDCPICQRHRKLKSKLARIILSAYPDLGDRSEIQSDYFDYIFSIV